MPGGLMYFARLPSVCNGFWDNFEYPYEIMSNEVACYIREEQSYEDTVNEMERKMNMYLNE